MAHQQAPRRFHARDGARLKPTGAKMLLHEPADRFPFGKADVAGFLEPVEVSGVEVDPPPDAVIRDAVLGHYPA